MLNFNNGARHFRCISAGAYLRFNFGVVKLILESGGICMALRAMLRVAKPRVCQEGSGACSPEKILNNGAIWCVLAYILLQFCPKKFVKMFIFYIKIIDIVLLRTIFRGIGAYSRMFVYCAIWCVLEYIFRERSLKKIYMII